MSGQMWLVFCAVLLVSCDITNAREKRIRLEDIEQDNLKSEAELITRGQYLKPPSIDAEQTADYGPPERDYGKKQYAVEEDSSSETPPSAYASNVVYLATEGGKDFAQQATTSPQSSLHAHYLGYVPAMAMHLVYLPQVDVSSGNNGINYPTQYQKNVPAIVYQPIGNQPYVQIGQKQQYQSDKGYQKTSSNIQYVQVPQTAPQQTTGYDQSNYVYVPQNYHQEEQQQQQVDYAPQKVTYQQYAEPHQYSNYASQEYSVEDNSITQNHVYPNDDQPPSAPYRTITPKYVAPQKTVTNISPPPAAFYTPTSGKAGDTPRVLSEHAHGVSKPIYSHISGNLPVQDSYKQSFQGYSNYYPAGNYVQQSTYYGNYKPKSLLDSYIPSSLQVEYLKRGLSKEPLATYDLIANSRNYRLEGGFQPNQLYTTGNGGVVYEQFKRSTEKNE